MVSPPDVFDTESARGHPRPVLYHLWTKVAARSCLIEEAPGVRNQLGFRTNCCLGPGPQAPYGTLTRVAPLSVLPASR